VGAVTAIPEFDDVDNMLFSEIVGLLNEPNMCSGGYNTLHDILRAAPWLARRRLSWLEVGSNTGFSCLELASLLEADVTGIDINPRSVELARTRASELGLTNVSFLAATGTQLPFEDDKFDVVLCSNVTSFISDRETAVREYFRVLKPRGFLLAMPIYYVGAVPDHLVARVEAAIGAPLTVTSEEGWKALFCSNSKLIYEERFTYVRQSKQKISDYARGVAAQPSNDSLPEDVRAAAALRLEQMYALFDENLQHAGFSILIYRAGMPTEWPILHETKRAEGTTGARL
jgi:ubiquinone/menaquinone biosynthesis C-methylase UbiE